MPNLPISGLNASAANLTATDLLPVVQTSGVGPVKMTGLQLAGGLLGSTTLTGATVTTSKPVLDLSQTWNAGAVTFTGLKFNATDTASASGSLLLDIGTGGGSFFRVDKTGGLYIKSNATATNGYILIDGRSNGSSFADFALRDVASGASWGLSMRNDKSLGISYYSGSGSVYPFQVSFPAGAGVASFNTGIGFTTGQIVASYNTPDAYLIRADTAKLQLGAADAAAPVAQTLQVQSVVAGTTNTAGANFTIAGSKGTGTGAGGSIIFQVAPAGGSGTAQNALATALKIDADKTTTITHPAGANYVTIFNNNGIDLYTSTNQRVGSINSVSINSQNWLTLYGVNGVSVFGQLSIGNGSAFLWGEAANTLALRNGANAQKLSIYNTYTSGTSYERYDIDWITTANTVLVGPTKGSGGGTQRTQRLQYLEDGGSGSTTPSLGTTCPAASATVKSWIKVITSDGTTAYIPCWA